MAAARIIRAAPFIALCGQKGAARQIADQCLVDRRAGEVEVDDVPGLRRGRLLASGSELMSTLKLYVCEGPEPVLGRAFGPTRGTR
jgi:hypothetical protein